MSPPVQPYWDHCDELVVDGQLIVKVNKLVIPVCLRTELMAVTHASRVDIEGVFIERESASNGHTYHKT